ncbi:cytochrome c [Paroceanicella profunda]|uniref:Cytochrome c n=1 Tax=Paroceanicella profunda TaxID=2579971 RepID=A0A5B8FH87_9RHOB|nr:cytochrome c [Paroceanicella profunda]QDL92141.1 cytochrome c [Paroceanicella profunda]
MFRTAILAAALACPAGLALAQDSLPAAELSNPISLRQHAMENIGKAMGLAGAMMKGEAPYDARVADAALRTFNNGALGLGLMFPQGSDGGATAASPKVWEDAAGFSAAVQKFIDDTTEAVAAAPADLDAFKPVFGKVASNCRACHEDYRVKRN